MQRQLSVVALVGLLMLFALQIGSYFADLLRILAISFLISYLVINVVDFFDRFIHNRALAIAIVYIAMFSIAIVSAFFLIPAMLYQVASLINTTINEVPNALEKLNQALLPLQQRFQDRQIDIKVADVVTNFVAQVPKPDPGAIAARITDIATSTMTWSVYSVSISVVTFYFLLDGHRMKDAVVRLFPNKFHTSLNAVAGDADRSLQAFFKGQLVLGVLFGIIMLGVYALFKVQYALLLSVFLGLCEILPVIGPPLGFFPAVIAVAIHGSSLPGNTLMQIVLLTAIFMVLQQIKDSVVAPRYIGNVIGLHPVLIFIAIMVGARLDGVLGIIIALPAACVLSVLFTHWPLAQRHDQFPISQTESIDAISLEGRADSGPGSTID